jgi:hypothetical protein
MIKLILINDLNNKEIVLQFNNNSNKNINNNTNNNNNNGAKRLDYYGQEISKNNKKHRISFIEQIQSKKEIAQIIYINNEQESLKGDKIDTNKCFEILRKQSTNITEFTRKENQNETETYKIKRPKNSNGSRKMKREKKEIEEKCGCQIF